MEDGNSELGQIFEAHGLQSVPHEDWLAISGTLPAIRCFYDFNESGTARVTVQTLLSDSRIIDECFAGTGANPRAAFLDGLMNFGMSSLHVLLSAFWNKSDEQQVTCETWSIGGDSWIATVGNFTNRASKGVQVQIPDNLFGTIESEIKKERFSNDVSWVRVYFGHLNGQTIASEFLINNERRPNSEAEIQNLNWSKVNGFYSVRIFLALKKVGAISA